MPVLRYHSRISPRKVTKNLIITDVPTEFRFVVPHEYMVHVFPVSSYSVRLVVRPTEHGGTLKLRASFRLCVAVVVTVTVAPATKR